MSSREAVTASEEQTEALGVSLAASLPREAVIYLSGELGAGKTTLVRGIARGVGARARQVASPTFALLHEYEGEGGEVVLRHLDLYRLKDDPRELEVLGLPDLAAGAPVCVEWPREALRPLLAPTHEISFETLADGRRRILVRLTPHA